ncbi:MULTISPECIES: hypothetical protein [Bacillus]|uniref:hypothetical protein n=1 Tax=Bacillus TaxID=1386 RepID=UPI00089C01D9|nr:MULTISPECIES: hypothetical protein [Bacillus]WIY60874.1 hypothetical protein QRY57_24275 [Bacillus arachidis]SDZ30697.1 hypothetical protein SAMN04488156_11538 [Bacillus sp. 166amftsu]
MKNTFYLFFTIFFTCFILVGCIDANSSSNSSNQSQETEKSIKKAVWNQLSNQEKQYIIGDWENATMTKTTFHKHNSHQSNEEYEGKTVYLVHFPSDTSAPKNVEVYVDIDTNEIVGYNK